MKYFKPLFFVAFAMIILSFSNANHQTNVNTSLENMVLVQTGTFRLGIDSVQLKKDMARFNEPASFFSQEYPSIRVTVQPYYIDKYEVTNAEYKEFVKANPQWSKTNIADSLQDGKYLKDWKGDKYPKGEANYPVTYVSYYAASAYAKWRGKRLPMEVELEYAAKGNRHVPIEFPWGNADATPVLANYAASSGHPVRVGSYSANDLGIYDLAGNVSEFCLDRWQQDSYAWRAQFAIDRRPGIAKTDPKKVVIRGGSWNDPAVKLRTTWRESCGINSCNAYTGFRCVANANISRVLN